MTSADRCPACGGEGCLACVPTQAERADADAIEGLHAAWQRRRDAVYREHAPAVSPAVSPVQRAQVDVRSEAEYARALRDYCFRAVTAHLPRLLAPTHPRLAASLRAMPPPPVADNIHGDAWRAWLDALRWELAAHRGPALAAAINGRVPDLLHVHWTEAEWILPAVLESIVGRVELIPRRPPRAPGERMGGGSA